MSNVIRMFNETEYPAWRCPRCGWADNPDAKSFDRDPMHAHWPCPAPDNDPGYR